jgi:hypothetical protein
VVGLFVQSLNETIDLHAKRVQAGIRSRIPGAIWVGLLTVAVLSLTTLGYFEGLAGTRRSLAVLADAVAFSVVIELIADLDRPQEGVLRVSQTSSFGRATVDEPTAIMSFTLLATSGS